MSVSKAYLVKNIIIIDQNFKILWANKMIAMRQLEVVELMIATNNYSLAYVKALFIATHQDQLNEKVKHEKVKGITVNNIARMEREMENLERDFKLLEESYGSNVLKLVQAKGYIAKLLENEKVFRYISRNYMEIISEFQIIVEKMSLED